MSLKDRINIPSSVERNDDTEKAWKEKTKRLKRNKDFILLNIGGWFFLFIF